MQTTPETNTQTLLSPEAASEPVHAPIALEMSPPPTQDKEIADINMVKFAFVPIMIFQLNI